MTLPNWLGSGYVFGIIVAGIAWFWWSRSRRARTLTPNESKLLQRLERGGGSGQQYDGDRVLLEVELLYEAPPIHDGHHEIGQDEIERKALS